MSCYIANEKTAALFTLFTPKNNRLLMVNRRLRTVNRRLRTFNRRLLTFNRRLLSVGRSLRMVEFSREFDRAETCLSEQVDNSAGVHGRVPHNQSLTGCSGAESVESVESAALF